MVQVYGRLQKMLLCLSHSQTLVTLDELGAGHDEEVRQWQANVTRSLTSEVGHVLNHMCLQTL